MLIALLMMFSTATYFYLKFQAFQARRQHLLCEVLRPGMTKNEVLSVLHEVGDFRVDEMDWTSGSFAVYVIFADPVIIRRY